MDKGGRRCSGVPLGLGQRRTSSFVKIPPRFLDVFSVRVNPSVLHVILLGFLTLCNLFVRGGAAFDACLGIFSISFHTQWKIET